MLLFFYLTKDKLGVVDHTYNPNIQEAKIGGLPRVPGQSVLD